MVEVDMSDELTYEAQQQDEKTAKDVNTDPVPVFDQASEVAFIIFSALFMVSTLIVVPIG